MIMEGSVQNPGAVKMNTEVRETVSDVDAYDGPLKRWAVGLVARLRAREIGVDDYQREAAARFRDPALLEELSGPIAAALADRQDRVLYRRQDGPYRDTLQLLYLAPREVHPPHCHHNLVSNQMNVHGKCYVREYDRVARLGENTLLLRIRQDGWFAVGDLMQTTEFSRNAHWFAADGKPCVVLNFYLLGYQEWTFDPFSIATRKGRQMLDPTAGAQADGYIVGKEISLEAGYAKFGGRPLTEFPVPRL